MKYYVDILHILKSLEQATARNLFYACMAKAKSKGFSRYAPTNDPPKKYIIMSESPRRVWGADSVPTGSVKNVSKTFITRGEFGQYLRELELDVSFEFEGAEEYYRPTPNGRGIFLDLSDEFAMVSLNKIHTRILELGYTGPEGKYFITHPFLCLKHKSKNAFYAGSIPRGYERVGLEFFEPVSEEEDYPQQQSGVNFDMKTNRALNLLDTSFYTVKVVFDVDASLDNQGQKYTYKVPNEYKVSVEDMVVITHNGGYKVTKCVHVDDVPDIGQDRNYTWIFGSFSRGMYLSCIARDEKLRQIILEKERQSQVKEMQEFMKDKLGIADFSGIDLPAIEVDKKGDISE